MVQMGNKKCWLPLAISVMILTGCSSDKKPDSAFREQGVKQAALSYGAQHGLAWQNKRIAEVMGMHNGKIEQIYNFNAMIMRDNIMPPILDQNGLTLELSDSDTLTLSDQTIKIVEKSRFVTTPPSWRDYLEATHKKQPKISEVSKTLLPQNGKERAIWDENVVKGWDNGYHQANEILRANLGRLTRDFVGMSLFHALYAQNMVSRPYVANARLGITGDSSEVHVNQKISRIVSHAELNFRDPEDWKPAIMHEPPASANYNAQYMDPDKRSMKVHQGIKKGKQAKPGTYRDRK